MDFQESHREAKVKPMLATALSIIQAVASVVFILSVSLWNFRIKYEIGSEPEGGSQSSPISIDYQDELWGVILQVYGYSSL